MWNMDSHNRYHSPTLTMYLSVFTTISALCNEFSTAVTRCIHPLSDFCVFIDCTIVTTWSQLGLLIFFLVLLLILLSGWGSSQSHTNRSFFATCKLVMMSTLVMIIWDPIEYTCSHFTSYRCCWLQESKVYKHISFTNYYSLPRSNNNNNTKIYQATTTVSRKHRFKCTSQTIQTNN